MAGREPRIQSVKGEKKSQLEGISHFLVLEKNVRGRVRKGKKRKRNKKNENFPLQSKEFRRSEFVGPRMKVHLLDEGCMWVLKTRDFSKDSSEEFRK